MLERTIIKEREIKERVMREAMRSFPGKLGKRKKTGKEKQEREVDEAEMEERLLRHAAREEGCNNMQTA